MVIIFFFLGSEIWNAWEGSLEANIGCDILGWQGIEFSLVRLHMLDKVHKVSGLFEELKILGINFGIAQLNYDCRIKFEAFWYVDKNMMLVPGTENIKKVQAKKTRELK